MGVEIGSVTMHLWLRARNKLKMGRKWIHSSKRTHSTVALHPRQTLWKPRFHQSELASTICRTSVIRVRAWKTSWIRRKRKRGLRTLLRMMLTRVLESPTSTKCPKRTLIHSLVINRSKERVRPALNLLRWFKKDRRFSSIKCLNQSCRSVMRTTTTTNEWTFNYQRITLKLSSKQISRRNWISTVINTIVTPRRNLIKVRNRLRVQKAKLP